jgi:c(7)-type cytochrome triheme protein
MDGFPEVAAAGFRRAAVVAFSALLLSGAATAADLLGDITMNRISTKNGVPAVVFPHWKHRARFRCYACHPDVFEMQSGSNQVDMEGLRSGEFCGRCHDGKTAWAIGFDTCRECHSLGEM